MRSTSDNVLQPQDVGTPAIPKRPPKSPNGMPTNVSTLTGGARWTVPPTASNGAYLFVRSANAQFIATAARQNAGTCNPWPLPTPTSAQIGANNVVIGSLTDPAAVPSPLPSGLTWTYLAVPADTTITVPPDQAGDIPADAAFWFAAA